MNVTENYLLQQMQTLATAMSNVPQTGNNKTGGSSFQDMMDQAGKATQSSQTSQTSDAPKDAEPKDVLKEKLEELKKDPLQTEEEEEVKPELLAANPNAVSILDMFRPDVVQPAEEPVIEVPVDAIASESVEGPDLALDGQMAEMETGVEANVESGVSMERQPRDFQDAMEEVPQERPEENVQSAEAPEVREEAPRQVEDADQPQAEDVPEIEVHTETDEEAGAAVLEAEQPVFHEAESAPVKVGETYEPVDTQQPDMDQKLSETILNAAQSGAEKIEIRLTPQNLGSLTIEMTKDVNGALQVVLHASSAKAANLLNQHMDGLQMALRSYSQEEVRVQVQRNDESQQQNFRQADPDGRGQHQQRQQEQRKEEEHSGEAFMQKLRLGLFDEI